VRNHLTEREQLVLYGLIRYPDLKDRELSEQLGVKHSTLTSIRRRLQQKRYFRTIRLPYLQHFGCELLAVIHTHFNPVIPLQKRVDITEEKIEAAEELFFSIGEFEKGFSLSLAENYTAIGKINDVRTETFGKLGLLEKNYPTEAIFPFAASRVYRFFDYAPLIKNRFNLDGNPRCDFIWPPDHVHLSSTERRVLYGLVKHPNESDKTLAAILGVARQTVSRLRKQFEEQGYLAQMRIPNLRQLGFEILAFYHVRYDPANPPDFEEGEAAALLSDNVIFMASRPFETVIIAAYHTYGEYKADKVEKMQMLKEREWIATNPVIRTYSLSKSEIIKDFTFAPITKKILHVDDLPEHQQQ
jgi:DNA-binding MarR family transcriptional regulator